MSFLFLLILIKHKLKIKLNQWFNQILGSFLNNLINRLNNNSIHYRVPILKNNKFKLMK